jgi:alpha-D-xyloside xylohydrolase
MGRTLSVAGGRYGFRAFTATLLLLGAAGSCFAQAASAQDGFTFNQDSGTIVLQPYGPNIIRVTLSKDAAKAEAAAGYGIIGKPTMDGWTKERAADGSTTVRSGELVVRVSASQLTDAMKPQHMPLDSVNQALRTQYFGGGNGHGPSFDNITVTTASGKMLVNMRSWSMVRNPPNHAMPSVDTGSRVSATFDSPSDEHYYGLGQHQQGFLDLRDHQMNCWHDYVAPGGQTVCVPFMVSSRGYGFVWDNPSKTTINLGFNLQNVWSSEVGDRVSFFVIAGSTTDKIYEGYRQLTGVTHMLPKPVYGYIQSKAIYPTQEQILDVAKGYRDRNLPADVLVVDFLNMTRQGELDLDPKRWPDPAAMNDQLHAMGFRTLLSVWPHFAEGTRYYDMLREKGWLVHGADGTPDGGNFSKAIGPNIDTTNPEAANWFWEKIRDRYVKPDHFDYIWLDETEPDIDPEHDYFYIGSGARYYNAYPLFHTASVYEGFRRDFGDSRRVMILARAAYLGAQRNGTVFWSSDIMSTWDMLKRSISTGLDFTATGLPYWDTDIAGFFSPSVPVDYHPERPPLIDGSDVKSNIGNYADYPELFVRWFEWGVFQPVMRAHGEREHNEVWSFGKQAEPILAKYLRLRYQLLPYTYSLAYNSYQTGAPFMRALFMDFPNDPRVANLGDEYMFGPALLVAPVTDQGMTHREVYLPKGCDWYNYWTNERLKGGQTITANAPIDTIPLFVRAGSILPLGSAVLTTAQPQAIESVRVYPGADASFTLFSDDGTTYGYEEGHSSITRLHWDNAAKKLTHTGAAAWKESDGKVVHVIGK